MVFYLLIVFIVIIAAAIGVSVWFILRARRISKTKPVTKEATKPERIPFRWSYILLPLVILSLSIAMAAYFYPRLPAEVAVQLRFDGAPDRFISRGMVMAMAIAPQVFLTALSAGMVWIITRLGVLSRQSWSSQITPERILWLMGNLFALPQGVLSFTMFNVFLYNVSQTQIIPTWLFLLIILGVGGALLGIFLVYILFRVRKQATTSPPEPPGGQDNG